MSSFDYALVALLAVLALATFTHTTANVASGDLDEDFAFDLSEDLEVDFTGKETTRKSWDLNDLKAPVGRLFHASVPRYAQEESINRFEAKMSGGKPLPSWLLFDKQSGVFWGVPSSNDMGVIELAVKGFLKSSTVSSNFQITVEDQPKHGGSKNKCPPTEDYTVLNLLLDVELEAIKPKQKVIAVNNVANFLGLPTSAFYLSPQIQSDDIMDSSVILAGPGTVTTRSSMKPSVIQVAIGCDGRIWVEEAPMIRQLKAQAREGIISEVLRLPLIGWRVKMEMHASPKRKRRNTLDDIGSGNYYEDYNYEDDEYDDEDYSGAEDTNRESDIITSTTSKKLPPTTMTTTSTTTTSTTTTTTTTPQPTTSKQTTTEESFVEPTVPHTSETHGHRHHHGENMPMEIVPTIKTVPFLHPVTPEATTRIMKEPEEDDAGFIVPESEQIPITTMTQTTSSTPAPTPAKEPEVITEKIEITKIDIPKLDEVIDNYDDYDDGLDEDIESETEVPDYKQISENVPVVEVEPQTTTPIQHFTPKAPPKWIEAVPTETTPKITEPSIVTTTTEVITTILPEEEITDPPTTSTSTTTEASTTTLLTTTKAVMSPSSTTYSTTTDFLTTLSSTLIQKITTFTDDYTSTAKQTTQRHISSTPKTTTEYIEYGVKNFPPNVRKRLDRKAIQAGKYFKYVLPKDTFWDMEDGNDLKYEVFTPDREQLNKDSWLQFNPRTREFYGLPLDEDASRWKYLVVATDKEGLSAEDTLELVVQQSRTLYTVNHEFSLHVHVDKKQEFKHSVDWALRILQSLGTMYNQLNISDITVRKITYTTDPVVFTWTNESLPKNYCPKSDIQQLFDVLTKNNDGEPSIMLRRTLAPEFFVKKVTYTGLGVCEPQPQTPITPPTNFSPILRNPIDHINATVGELLVYRVPDDTFYDPEDQDSRILKMTLLTGDRQPIPMHSWLQFDSKNKEFYGIPLFKDVGEHEYHLVCEDSGGLPASDSLVVKVRALYRIKYNVEFSMTVETSYESFIHSASMQRKFIEKLRDLFGDRDTNNIHLGSITNTGSTVVSWFNKSLPIDICPRDEIRRLESVLVNNDRTIATRVQEIMDPEFPVAAIKLQLIGSCKVRPSVQSPDVIVPPDDTTTRETSDEYLITFIVPIVVVSIMLFLAGIAACILYRRRRTGKMNVEEDGRSVFGNKGIPVIFQEELEEKPESGTKAPVILKDEKPPLAPPEYSKSGSVKLTDDSEPYQPPPPFTRTQDNGRQSRPKHTTPTYRKPPPYVPP